MHFKISWSKWISGQRDEWKDAGMDRQTYRQTCRKIYGLTDGSSYRCIVAYKKMTKRRKKKRTLMNRNFHDSFIADLIC